MSTTDPTQKTISAADASEPAAQTLKQPDRPRGFGVWWNRVGRFMASHLFLITIACTMLLPFLWMIVASGKPLNEVDRFSPLPSKDAREYYVESTGAQEFSLTGYYAHNYKKNFLEVLNSKDISFKRYYFNSLFIAAWVTLLQCFTSSLAAFSFSRIQWPMRDHVFKLYLATMMIPGVVTMIPNYVLMVKLHLLDSYAALIVPAAFSAFGTFMLRQFMLTIPTSLDEAATIDGATHWQIYWDVILPLARPGLVVLTIFTFLGNYGSFFWPLVCIKSEHLRTLPIGMLYYDTAYGRQTNLVMAATVMCIVPLIALFIVMQKQLVRGIQLGAVKG